MIEGDCAEVMRRIPEGSVDSIVTDPPYGLKFMGKGWDDTGHGSEQQAWHYRWAVEALRVLKPGGYLLAFGGTRTYHRMTAAVEDAGFEIRDQIQWLYGTGFPKSHNISKAIDKAAGAEREVVGSYDPRSRLDGGDRVSRGHSGGEYGSITEKGKVVITESITPEAIQWEGWGTALKPAHEPIVLARKFLIGTVAENVSEHGTGGLNIDESRIETTDSLGGGAETQTRSDQKGHEGWTRPWMEREEDQEAHAGRVRANVEKAEQMGRWPANVIMDEGAGEMLDEQTGEQKSGTYVGRNRKGEKPNEVYGTYQAPTMDVSYGDSGGASRFFYCAKASKAEREQGLAPVEDGKRANTHPTVKPVALMEYLIRLVAPPGGIVLDPFAGSGTTGKAAVRLGFPFFGIELEPEFVELARKRIEFEVIG